MISRLYALLFLLGICSSLPVSAEDAPLIIAHRGASGYLPEHTIESYTLAIDMGADYIEPDLVLSKDGVLMVRHDHYLSTTTNVSEIMALRKRKKALDQREDWYSEDLTSAEFSLLRARQAFKGRTTAYDDQFHIPTFAEVIKLAIRKTSETGRPIGIYPELKLPQRFKSLGFDVVRIFLDALKENGIDGSSIPIYIQSFDQGILKELRDQTDLPLIQLVNPVRRNGLADRSTPDISIDHIAQYANGVGAYKSLVATTGGKSSGFIEAAHKLNLQVHIWTLRNDAYPDEVFESAEQELQFFMLLGVDGLFADFPDSAIKVRDRLFAQHSDKTKE